MNGTSEDDAPSFIPKEFSSRVDSVFGALGGAGGWTLRQAAPFQLGRPVQVGGDGSSSDEEEVAGSDGEAPPPPPLRQGRRAGSDDEDEEEDDEDVEEQGGGREQGDQEDVDFQPSDAFIRAFEAEPDEDDFDRFAMQTGGVTAACGGGGVGSEVRPHGSTEVAEDSIYERLYDMKRAVGADHVATAAVSGHSHDVEMLDAGDGCMVAQDASRALTAAAAGVRVAVAAAAASAAASASTAMRPSVLKRDASVDASGHVHKSQRGVRWAAEVDARETSCEGAAASGRHTPREEGGSNQQPQPPLQQQLQALPPHARRVQLDWQRKGFVPDHVRNPDRYTCYVLDEPLTVGGGEAGGSGYSRGSGGGGGGDYEELAPAPTSAKTMATAGAEGQGGAASSTQQQRLPEPLPASGAGGITFRSKAQRQAEQCGGSSEDPAAGGAPASRVTGSGGAGSGAASKPGKFAAAAAFAAADAVDMDHEEDGHVPTAAAPVRRNFRAPKQPATAEELP